MKIFWPELGIDLTAELKQAENGNGGDYFVALSVDPLKDRFNGDLNILEGSPSIFYHTIFIQVTVTPESSITDCFKSSGFTFIGKLINRKGSILWFYYRYIILLRL